MKVGEMIQLLENFHRNTEVVFQGNIRGEEDSKNEATYTICTGMLQDVFDNGKNIVIDCHIKDSEGGILSGY